MATISSTSLVQKIARNSASVLGAQVVLRVLAFFFNVYVVRQLGDAHFGRYSAIVAYVAMFGIFTDWGMSPYAVREMARDRSQTAWLLPNIVAIRALLSVLIVAIAPLSAVWLGKDDDMVLGILIASAGLILYAFQGPLDSALTARERLDYVSVFAVVNQLVFWGVGVLLLVNGFGFVGLVVASLAGLAVVVVLSGWALSKMGIGRPVLSVRRWPELFRAALPFGVGGIAGVFRVRFDTVLMSFVLTDAAVGWYNVPWTLINMVLLIPRSIAVAIYPSMVRSHTRDPGSLFGVVWRSIKYLLIICLPIAVGGTILADRIIIALYEDGFSNSIPVLRIMLWALPSLFLLELLGRVAVTLHLERPSAQISVINAVITVGLNLLLMPGMGILGAALAFLAGRTIRLLQYWHLLGSQQLVGRRWHSLLRVGLAAAAMGTVVFSLGQMSVFGAVDSRVGLLALVGIGALTYAVALLTFGGIERQEMRFLGNIVRERVVGEVTP